MKELFFYYRSECHLCDEMLDLLEIFKKEYSFALKMCNIEENDEWHKKYFLEVPVLRYNQNELFGKDMDFITVEKFVKESLLS